MEERVLKIKKEEKIPSNMHMQFYQLDDVFPMECTDSSPVISCVFGYMNH